VVTWQEVWGRYWYEYLGFWKGLAGCFVERMVIAFARDVIVYAPSIQNQLQRYPGKKNLRIIPNGIDLAHINAVTPDQEKFDLIFVGRLIRDKHVETVLRTVWILKDKKPDLRCLIIGLGPEKQNLQRLVVELGLKQQVSFKESLEYKKVISLMKAAKVFVFPSAREGFGIAVIEAQACGLPVILARHPMNAAVELVKDGLTGYICEPDEKDFAIKIKALLNDEGLRTRMSIAARRSAELYDWDNVAKMNEEFYIQILANNAGVKR
jgi:glycosyltransferase involved in cell wall biosynthesis